MAKNNLKRQLYDLQNTGRFENLKLFEVCRKFIWKLSVRYYLLGYLDNWLMKEDRYKTLAHLPTPVEWLTLAPLRSRDSGLADSTTLVDTVFEKVKRGMDSGIKSLIHISCLFKMSKVIKMIDISDHRDGEFIKSIPRQKDLPLRAYTDGNFTIYFINVRYIILRYTDEVKENYFVKVYDLGGVLQYITESLLAIPQEKNTVVEMKLKKELVTTHMPYVNKHLHLLDNTDQQQHYWFVESKVHRRNPMYAITYNRAVIPESSGMGIPESVWEQHVKDFAIPTTSKLIRARGYETKLRATR